jgi:hypothetical protein
MIGGIRSFNATFPPKALKLRYFIFVLMILPQVHLRKPCYDFSFL